MSSRADPLVNVSLLSPRTRAQRSTFGYDIDRNTIPRSVMVGRSPGQSSNAIPHASGPEATEF